MGLKNMMVANFLLSCAGSIQLAKLNKASRNPQKAASTTLRNIITYAKDTAYGKEHNFEQILQAKTDEELFKLWQADVPVNEYEDLRPYVERHKNGEANVLFPGKPVMYATTSGSTAEPKWIPMTQEYMKMVYSKMTHLWLFNFIRNRPKVYSGKALSIVGKVIEGYAPDGTVHGSVSGVTQRDCPKFMKVLYSNPQCVYSITDYNSRYYVLMRMGIEQDISIIITANPSTIVELQNNVNEYFDEYVTDIENGTISQKLKIAPEIRTELEACVHPNPKRAKELRALKAKYGTVLPKHYWPNLQVLNTWKCGNTDKYIEKFQGSLPEHTLHMEFGYFASECRFGLVMDDTLNTVLFPHFHYYEFVREEDLEKENPEFLQLSQLEEGKRYCPFITTWAGLYRYNMTDLLEVGPKYKNSPTVHLIQKTKGIVSMTGEKLYEKQFCDAVHKVEKESGMMTRFFVGFADQERSSYDFYWEFSDRSTTQAQAEEFTRKVDAALKEINCEYGAKRDSLRIKAPATYRLVKDSFETFKQRCIDEGARDGQFKLTLLLLDEKRHAKFKQLVVNE